VVLGLIVGSALLSLAGCERGEAEGTHGAHGPFETSAGLSQDATEVRSFWNIVQQFPAYEHARFAPAPETPEELVSRSAVVVLGVISDVQFSILDWEPAANLPGQLVKIAVDLTIRETQVLKGRGPRDREPLVWQITAWTGDPKLASDVLPDIEKSIGTGPIGARVLLGAQRTVGIDPSLERWYAVGGVLESQSGDAAVALTPVKSERPSKAFSDVDELVKAIAEVR
jgi:hypothetical protein